MSTREEVYAAIDGERNYQDETWPEPESSTHLSLGEEILLIREYVERAQREWTGLPGNPPEALAMVRKIAGIAVRCLENHGAPERRFETPRGVFTAG